MKSTLAILGAASTASALLGLDVNLPLGISVDLDLLGPKSEPCAECSNIWHPPHDGIIIDGCDSTGDHEWHWVHPCPEETNEPSYTWGTVTATLTNTVTNCEVCAEPTTVTYVEETTVCPIPVQTTAVQTTVPAVPATSSVVVVQPSVPVPAVPSVTSTSFGVPPSTFTSVYQTNTMPAPPAQGTPIVPVVPVVPVVPGTPVVPGAPGMPTNPVVPVVPAPPAQHTPYVPGPSPTYGNNATNPIATPPYYTTPSAAGAAQNTVGLVLAAALAIALW